MVMSPLTPTRSSRIRRAEPLIVTPLITGLVRLLLEMIREVLRDEDPSTVTKRRPPSFTTVPVPGPSSLNVVIWLSPVRVVSVTWCPSTFPKR